MKVLYGKARHIDKITVKNLDKDTKTRALIEIKRKGACGLYFLSKDKIVLGLPPNGLYSKYPEKAFCIVLSHEIIHRWLEKNIGKTADIKFDNIAKNLFEYGVFWNYADIHDYHDKQQNAKITNRQNDTKSI